MQPVRVLHSIWMCVCIHTSWVALVAQLVERSPRLESVMGLNPTQGNSSFIIAKRSCPGCSWLVCCAFASFYLVVDSCVFSVLCIFLNLLFIPCFVSPFISLRLPRCRSSHLATLHVHNALLIVRVCLKQLLLQHSEEEVIVQLDGATTVPQVSSNCYTPNKGTPLWRTLLSNRC